MNGWVGIAWGGLLGRGGVVGVSGLDGRTSLLQELLLYGIRRGGGRGGGWGGATNDCCSSFFNGLRRGKIFFFPFYTASKVCSAFSAMF